MEDINSDDIAELQAEILTEPKPKRIAKRTGKPDKRTITSKENAKKAGQAKLAKLKAEKEQQELQYEVVEGDLSDSSSSEDDNVLVLKQKSGKGKKKMAVKQSTLPVQNSFDFYSLKNDIDQIKQVMNGLSVKKKAKPRTKIIKVAAPVPTPAPLPIQQQPEQMSDHIKKKLLNF